MPFKPVITGHIEADRIAREHGEHIAASDMSIRVIRATFKCSDYGARRVRVACGLSTADPKAVTQRRRSKTRAADERQVLAAGDGDDTKGSSYAMDTLADEYIFTFPKSKNTPPFRMPRAAVAQFVMDYSNAGGQMTRSALATAWALPRWQAISMLRALGIVKAAVPFTEEDVKAAVDQGAVAGLEARWLAAVKQQVEARVERTKDVDLARDAQRWRESSMYTLEWAAEASASLAEAVHGWEASGRTRWLASAPPDTEKATLVLGLTDLHYGSYAWSGTAGQGKRWDRELCKQRLASAIDAVFRRLPAGLVVERIVLPVGSDMAHVDNATGATTKLTPQDMDGTPEQMVHELWELVFLTVLSLAERAPVDLWMMEGNHDHILGHALFASLSQVFRDSERVRCRRDSSKPHGPYQVGVYGQTLLGFAHGDGRSDPRDLAAVMAQQAHESWSNTKHRIWVSGHRHVHSVREEHGVEVHILPSLSGVDRYHQKRWPLSQEPRMKGLVLHAEDGLVASVFGKPNV